MYIRSLSTTLLLMKKARNLHLHGPLFLGDLGQIVLLKDLLRQIEIIHRTLAVGIVRITGFPTLGASLSRALRWIMVLKTRSSK